MSPRRALVALLLLTAACAGEIRTPFVAVFPMGPRQLRVGLYERFSELLAPEATHWPETAAPLRTELTLVQEALVEPGAINYQGQPAYFEPAIVSVDGEGVPVSAVELLLAPADAANADDPRAVAVAHGSVPGALRENGALTYAPDGPALLQQALAGTWPPANGERRVRLFLRGRALVELQPGAQLPGSNAEASVVLDLPFRYVP